jgi:hypothetical protein
MSGCFAPCKSVLRVPPSAASGRIVASDNALLIVRDDVVFNFNHRALCELAVRDNTQVPNDSFNEHMPIKKVAMQATDDRSSALEAIV